MATLSKKKPNTLFIAQFAILLALEAVFCFTVLGSIPIGPLVATLAMLPVIVAGILLGTGAGAAMGFAAGLFSFLVWTFMPPSPVTAFVFTPAAAPGNFWSLVICFVPRILTGVVASLVYKLLSRLLDGKKGATGVIYADKHTAGHGRDLRLFRQKLRHGHGHFLQSPAGHHRHHHPDQRRAGGRRGRAGGLRGLHPHEKNDAPYIALIILRKTITGKTGDRRLSRSPVLLSHSGFFPVRAHRPARLLRYVAAQTGGRNEGAGLLERIELHLGVIKR